MTLRAIGFHESISANELEETLRHDQNQLFGVTLEEKCSQCRQKFVVFFPAYDDPENPKYLVKLQESITSDCNGGQHPARKYRFSTTP